MVVKTCKECLHCEPPRNPKWPDCIYCSENNGHYDPKAQLTQAQNSCFTPKPKEPERNCNTCRLHGNCTLPLDVTCSYNTNPPLEHWQPIEPPKPKEPEKACKNCRFSRANTGGNWCCQNCSGPKRKAWQPIPKPAEKEVNRCYTCADQCSGVCTTKTAQKGGGWCSCNGYIGWQPKPGQATPEEREKRYRQKMAMSMGQAKGLKQSTAEYQMRLAQLQANPPWMYNYKTGLEGFIGGSVLHGPISAETDKPKPPKKAKEKTMFKKVKHLIRMAGTCWLMYGLVFKFIIPVVTFANPHIVWLWISILGKDEKLEPTTEMLYAWFFTAMAIFFGCIFTYGLHKFTEFFFGEKK